MSENLISNNIENSEFKHNTEEGDYEKLIAKLNEIKKKIALLEKTLFK